MRFFALTALLVSLSCVCCDLRPDVGQSPYNRGSNHTSNQKFASQVKKKSFHSPKKQQHLSNHDKYYEPNLPPINNQITPHRTTSFSSRGVDRKVYTIEEIFIKPQEITALDLRGNKRIRKLPAEIGNLTRLRTLDISGTNITFIPEEIGNCKELRYLVADACKLKTLPVSMGNLKSLKQLDLSHNKIREIPASIGQLRNLRELQLGGNKITALPASFEQLKNLRFCVLSNNDFVQFPRAVLGLESVQKLWMQGNRFQSIPLEITSLRGLREFLVDAHEIGTENMNRIYDQMPYVKIIDQEKNKSFF